MASSKKWATSISSIASVMYLLLIIFQIPLFRVQCRFGICKTPIEITSSQLIATELFPTHVVKFEEIYCSIRSPAPRGRFKDSYALLRLICILISTNISTFGLHQIVAGSYLSVVGAFLGLSRRGRMSLFGTMLIIWGFLRENILGQFQCMFRTESIQMYPTLMVAVVCAFLSIKKDVRKLIHGSKARRVKLL
ncbi:Aspartate-glutamate racemase family [Hibiscus syriacus]|uniref:Aspartate-glutamate racemase family n=1 Tax=Hibiscus syriacus TaxID=106335 RepID=A0A6A2YN88_HIBSY|nr:Aspartate-glutamate racemase family [Hibiscus syriacus]